VKCAIKKPGFPFQKVPGFEGDARVFSPIKTLVVSVNTHSLPAMMKLVDLFCRSTGAIDRLV
jgi:hypothetical protein